MQGKPEIGDPFSSIIISAIIFWFSSIILTRSMVYDKTSLAKKKSIKSVMAERGCTPSQKFGTLKLRHLTIIWLPTETFI